MSDDETNAPGCADDQPRKKRGKVGRPAYMPTDRDRTQVRVMAGMLGLRYEEICLVLGITLPTLRKYFRRELELSRHEANAQVAASLFRQATDAKKPSTIAGIFWMKCRAGWRDHDPAAGKKENQKEEATVAAEGGKKFAPGSAPLRVVK